MLKLSHGIIPRERGNIFLTVHGKERENIINSKGALKKGGVCNVTVVAAQICVTFIPSKIKWDLTNGPLSKLLEL